jgi:hypothetical protein
MSSTTRDAKDQPLEDENRPGRPAGPSRHWQTSADALYAMAREVSRLRGAVVTERHWCAEYLRGRETNLVKTRPPARHQPPATSPQHTTQHNTTQHTQKFGNYMPIRHQNRHRPLPPAPAHRHCLHCSPRPPHHEAGGGLLGCSEK